MTRRTRPIEILESRIAPAVFFVSGTDTKILDSAGNDVNVASAAGTVGATAAVLLHPGDSLVADLNGNHKADKGEATIMKVTAGSALVFFTDLNTNPGDTAHFDQGELTGIAAGDGLKATINSYVRGSIDTLLNGSDIFTTERQNSSIVGLTITGAVEQFIQAGGNISNVTIKAAKGGYPADVDLQNIFTGDAANNNPSFNGSTGYGTTFTQKPGTDAGDISNIKLSRGVGTVQAGNGGGNINGDGGAGGSVSNVSVTGQIGSGVYGGEGGNVSTSGNGGNGGSLNTITLNLKVDGGFLLYARAGNGGGTPKGNGGDGGTATDVAIKSAVYHNRDLEIDGGNGGSGGDIGKGGAGGAVANVSIASTAWVNGQSNIYAGEGAAGGAGGGGRGGDVTKASILSSGNGSYIAIYGGDGGDGTGTGNGGDSGNVNGATVKMLGYAAYGIYVSADDGGNALGTGNGGNGGSLSNVTVYALDSGKEIYSQGGEGGNAYINGNGGNGGAVNNVKFNVASSCQYGIYIYGGEGGFAEGNGHTGGDGGALSNSSLKALGYVNGDISVYGGEGGSGAQGNCSGGIGGNLSNTTVTVSGMNGGLKIYGGLGGDGGAVAGNGGKGGNLAALTVNLAGMIGSAHMGAGDGGEARSGSTGNGGDSGTTTGVKITNKGTLNFLSISHNGGTSNATTGNGGNSGNLSNVTVMNLGDVRYKISIGSRYGGNAGATGNGGNAGNATNLKIIDATGTTASWYIYAGSGGNGHGVGGKGGNGGNLSKVTFNGPNSNVFIGSRYDGSGPGSSGTGPAATGGNGGSISDVKGKAGTLRVVALRGGNVTDNGTAGNGGSVSNINFTVSQFARIVTGGDGGNVGTGGTAGIGGSVSKVKIKGDIGDFSDGFQVDGDDDTGMGGLIAGQGGGVNGVFDVERNGSISNVSATRIAAILAGAQAGNSLTSSNAVKAISGISASVIGADIDFDRAFDFVENATNVAGFQLREGADTDDFAVDGLVLVKAGAFIGKHVPPLLLVEV